MFNPFTEFPVLSIVAIVLLVIISQVVTFHIIRVRNQMGKKTNVKGEVILILPTLLVYLIVGYIRIFLPTAQNREDWKHIKQAKQQAKDFEMEIHGLTDVQVGNKFARRRIKTDLEEFNNLFLQLDPQNPLWKVSLEKEQLPHEINVLLQVLIELSTDFAFLEKNMTVEEGDLLEERTTLELCFEQMREVLKDHVDLEIDHAEDFIIDEITSALREADFYAPEEDSTKTLRNPAYDYFSLAWEKEDESIDNM
jgi:hypothetical protein